MNLNNSYNLNTESNTRISNKSSFSDTNRDTIPALKVKYYSNTVSGGKIEAEPVELSYEPKADIVLGTMDGSVINIYKDAVSIKFDNEKIYNFPIKLVADKFDVSLGQRVRYLIKKNSNGFKCQDFIRLENKSNLSLIKKINELLK